MLYFRVLEKVNFEKRFEALPQFNPERTDTDSPLPQSPRGLIVSYKNKKRKISSLGKKYRDRFVCPNRRRGGGIVFVGITQA